METRDLVRDGDTGPARRGLRPLAPAETVCAEQLLLLDAGMLLLIDRGFDSDEFLAKSAAIGVQLLVRLNSRRTPDRWAHLPDGSCLTRIAGVRLRTTDAQVTTTTCDGMRFTGHYCNRPDDRVTLCCCQLPTAPCSR